MICTMLETLLNNQAMTFILRDSKDESKLYLVDAVNSEQAKTIVKEKTGVDTTYYIGIVMPEEVLAVSTTGDPIISR